MAKRAIFILVYFFTHSDVMSQDLLVFINGYRGPKYDQERPNNQLHLKDPTGYWYKLDDSIQKRFNNTTSVYFDAHHPISTSTHRVLRKAVRSYLFSRLCWLTKESRWVLNKELNEAGFEERVANGKQAGLTLLNYILEHDIKKIHFVCHSMGYAYMLGMIDVLREDVTFGKALILSPEAANTQGRDWSVFEEVWQYGARADEKAADPIFLQDGIAPQFAVLGIGQLPNSTKGGRIYIPDSYPKRKLGFIKSHHLAYYDWFYWIKPEDPGYFKQ